jgi:hypothetical protein
MRFLQPKLFLLVLLPLCIFLTFNKHSRDKEATYHGVIWADAAGYYIYLPMWFIYGNDAAALPENADSRYGNGFHYTAGNTIATKYYCGTALLESPFFLIVHALAEPLGYKADGFSKIYSYGLFFSGIVYCCLGLFLLSLFLKHHFSPSLSTVTVLLLFCSTNLFYYSIDSPGMSHVYSFFLMTAFMYSVQRLLCSEKKIWLIALVLSFCLAVLTRPTNAIIILFPIFYENGAFLRRIKLFLQHKISILFAVLLGLLCFVPQLIYFKQQYNTTFFAYGDEGFSNWKHPYLLETWFSTNNGLFMYAPVLLLSVIGMIFMIRAKDRMGYYLLFTFLLISLIFASWWNWWFGCALGARSFVEFYPLLCIPIARAIQVALQNKKRSVVLMVFVVCCMTLYFKTEYYYDGCFYGGTWDFSAYLKLLQ